MTGSKRIKNITILSCLLIYIIIYRLFVVNNTLKYSEFINASVLMFLTSVAMLFYGYRKDKINPLTKKITIVSTIQIVMFFAISYGIGTIVGFLKNAYSLDFYSIIDNVFAPIVFMVCLELFRYVFINGNRSSKKSIVFLTILIILLEISITVVNINFKDAEDVFKLVTSVILPIIVKNGVFSYLTFSVGYRPAIIYRLIMDLYLFVLPIIPNLGEYIDSMIGICLPFIIYLYSSRAVDEYYNGVEYEFQKTIFRATDIPIFIFIIILVCLVSGYFPIYVVGIATHSMVPKINKGDAVIIRKIRNKDDIKIGKVIVYKNEGKNIVHRLVKIKKGKNGTYYRTKGDANPTEDNVNIKYKDIKGVVQFKIPYIAYPTIYFSEKIKSGV